MHVHAQAFEHSHKVTRHLQQQIEQAGGWLTFKDWMTEVLYAPGLGYYAAGSPKLALRSNQDNSSLIGDFVTAPELSPAFGRTLARQILQVMREHGLTQILEFGAGSGQLACDILHFLQDHEATHIQYSILEISNDLRLRQTEMLAHAGLTAHWLDKIPENFEGVILANEVLDAIPVHVLRWSEDAVVFERGVINHAEGFAWHDLPASPVLAHALADCMPALPGYITEINPQAQAWTRTLANHLKKGLILLVDYGFTQQEYYHPQRSTGTLMCHIQHRAHDDPFFAPGLQDITAHVNFSAIAASAHSAGLDVLGYTSQARFLLNAGLHEELLQNPDLQSTQHMRRVEKLLSEAEMGELFKVLALGKGIDSDLVGFCRGDRRHQL